MNQTYGSDIEPLHPQHLDKSEVGSICASEQSSCPISAFWNNPSCLPHQPELDWGRSALVVPETVDQLSEYITSLIRFIGIDHHHFETNIVFLQAVSEWNSHRNQPIEEHVMLFGDKSGLHLIGWKLCSRMPCLLWGWAINWTRDVLQKTAEGERRGPERWVRSWEKRWRWPLVHWWRWCS